MTCASNQPWPFPRAADAYRIMCFKRAQDASPIPLYVAPIVVAGEVTDYEFFHDAELTAVAVGYTTDDLANCDEVVPGSSANNPTNVSVVDPNYSYANMVYVAGNLTSWQRTTEVPGAPGFGTPQTQTFTHDALGNVTSISDWSAA